MDPASCCQSFVESWKIQNVSIHNSLIPIDCATSIASWNVFAKSVTATPSLKRWNDSDVSLSVLDFPQQWLSVAYCESVLSSSDDNRNRTLVASGSPISRRRVGRYGVGLTNACDVPMIVRLLQGVIGQSLWYTMHWPNQALAHSMLAVQSEQSYGFAAPKLLPYPDPNVSTFYSVMTICAYRLWARRRSYSIVCHGLLWL